MCKACEDSIRIMEDNRRNRIVINLDDKAAGRSRVSGGKKRRWPKVLATLLIVFVVIAGLAGAGIYFWWQHYKTTPAYSLALLVDAAQQNDTATVNQFLDGQKIVGNLASQVTGNATGLLGIELAPATEQRAQALVQSLGPGVQASIQQEVVKNIVELAQKSERRPFLVMALALPYAMNITNDGGGARAVFTTQGRNIDLMLARKGERWQVIGIKDDGFLKSIAGKLTANVPVVGQPLGTQPGRPTNPGRSPGSPTRRRR